MARERFGGQPGPRALPRRLPATSTGCRHCHGWGEAGWLRRRGLSGLPAL